MGIPTIPKDFYPAMITVSLFFISLSVLFYYQPKDSQIFELSIPLALVSVLSLLYFIYKWYEERKPRKFKFSLP
ncbi:MAG: hypothetical protein ABIE55_03645 [Candidatus Aenigmatarchaeota archaeon]